MSQSLCRWGILGTAAIARKNWRAIALSGNGRVAAVASRDFGAAERFIASCQGHSPQPEPAIAVGDYAALIDREDIDAVYIPLPTAMRHEWVIRAAEAGKHVLCEKPIAVSETAAREMIAACAEHGVQFMDGVMFMHSGRLEGLRRSIDDAERMGSLRRIASQFSFCGDEAFRRSNIRTCRQLEPFGCLGDLGWYNLRLTLWIMNGALPQRASGRILSELCGGESDGPVPAEFSGELFFADGVSASFYCSFLAENQQWAVISGERGYVRVDDFVLPWMGPELAWETCQHVFDTEEARFNMNRHARREAIAEYSHGAPGAQEVTMVQRFAELVRSGSPDPYWPEIALRTQQVMDACLRSAQQDGAAVELGGAVESGAAVEP
ncbi:Gfo/Idh/MocA family protein [Candidatus Laterigemmans baculatus]|uniref:Gfo/Idh/MocA family protein n=1 Tax=Candidatus Laterigemmans baculatus TaxID=2770505 RepID=UPI0013DC547D|nr:Gfo/Idh/MocA family oxidoreductase [Candidatus Laterigemmans baculatus]